MQKFDFDNWYNNEFKEKQPDCVKSSNAIVRDNMLQTAKACSEHYEEQIKQKLAAIDEEILKYECEETECINCDCCRPLVGLQKARAIIAGEEK